MPTDFSNIDLTKRSEVTTVIDAATDDADKDKLQEGINTLNAWARARIMVREAYASNNANVNVAANNTWYAFGSILTAGHGNNLPFANNNFEVPATGVYRFLASLSFRGLTNSILEFGIAVNNVVDEDHIVERFTSTNDVGAVSLSGFVSANVGDNVAPAVLVEPGANVGNVGMIRGCTIVLERVS